MPDYPTFGFVTPENMGLLTDLYELTMADSYLRQDMNGPATFDVFVRDLPPQRAFLVSAGLESVLHYLERVRFGDEGLAYLRSLGRFSAGFLDYLRDFRFTGSLRAIPEGEVFFPQEPIVEVTAPRIEAQIIETFLLNTLNFQVMIATKAARTTLAAQGRDVIDFSPRRDHGADAALKVARASFIGGCVGTSCVLAGQLYGIPVFGTMAHSYVMSFPDELAAFRAFARDFPEHCVLLIDTYDTIQGTRHAIAVAREMAARGGALRGVRIDSGDLVADSRRVRVLLNEAGLGQAQIVLSGGLNEFSIAELIRDGAAAEAFGVGTELGTSADAPFVEGVYKLVEDAEGYRIKLSTGKATLPGRKQVWRIADASGTPVEDLIALADEPGPQGAAPLLVEVMADGRTVRADRLADMQRRCRDRLAQLPPALRALRGASPLPVRLSPAMEALRARMYRQAAETERAR
ncbi:MAG: nicotinate phosphoribosyltransferase [Armatimonadetes bacterium]|nr:nicotinate phosphoribosyltransferase [Armatimonadota bacterium]